MDHDREFPVAYPDPARHPAPYARGGKYWNHLIDLGHVRQARAGPCDRTGRCEHGASSFSRPLDCLLSSSTCPVDLWTPSNSSSSSGGTWLIVVLFDFRSEDCDTGRNHCASSASDVSSAYVNINRNETTMSSFQAKAANPVNRRNQFASLGFILGFESVRYEYSRSRYAGSRHSGRTR
jgi:hypothetical protein